MNDEKQSEQFTIKTTGLTKTYPRGTGTFNALDSLDLNVAPGEFVAVMGASGSGKSTTLHLIAGLTRPTSGKVEIDGVDIFALRDAALSALRAEGIHKVALVAFKYNEAGNAFWEKMGFAVREDLNYRNRALSEMKRIDT